MLTEMLFNKYVNSSRVALDAFAQQAAASLTPSSRVLDAGAGDCFYQGFFSKVKYESADLCQVNKPYGQVTYVCDLAHLPVETERYDLVYCTQTLEHIKNPGAVLKEFYRVLKPGGTLWLTAPLFYEEHEVPYDYFRFTQYGLRELIGSAGFKVEQMEWLEGYYGTLAYQLRVAAASLPKHPWFYGSGIRGYVWAVAMLGVRPLLAALSAIFSRLDLRRKITFAGMCINYMAVARK
jgi:SAM-dependent methyltransferase